MCHFRRWLDAFFLIALVLVAPFAGAAGTLSLSPNFVCPAAPSAADIAAATSDCSSVCAATYSAQQHAYDTVPASYGPRQFSADTGHVGAGGTCYITVTWDLTQVYNYGYVRGPTAVGCGAGPVTNPAPACAAAGTSASLTISGGSGAFTANVGGCLYATDGYSCANGKCVGSAQSCGFPALGAASSAPQATIVSAPTTPTSCTPAVGNDCGCPTGQVNGTVGTTTSCYPSAVASQPGSSGSVSAKTQTDPATGNTTSTTIQQQTVCNGSSCTTTTTNTTNVYNSSGGAVGTPTTTTATDTTPQQSFCDTHPTDPQCKPANSISGDCNAPVSCSGDAIQCYAAKQAHDTACALQVPSNNAQLIEAQSVLAGSDPRPGNSVANGRTIAVAAAVDQSSRWTAQGFADQTITVSGRNITLPLSRLNQYLQMLGAVLVAVTGLLCVRILIPSIQGA